VASRKGRRLDGILLLDKPAGLSSNAALQRARRLFGAGKAGHTGSLDPLATGLLPVCFGEATKIAGLLLGANKAYAAEVTLGASTDTDDAEGQVLFAKAVPAIDVAMLGRALQPFLGTIRQRAPIYSALKQGGEPLYARARRGETIQAPVREVVIHDIRIIAIEGRRLRLHVTCGSGTYIRSLARDLGEALGCGAHISALRRLWVAPFDTPRMYTLDELEALLAVGGMDSLDSRLLPLEIGLGLFPSIRLDAQAAMRFSQGQRLQGTWPAAAPVAVMGPEGRALGLGQVDDSGLLSIHRLFNRMPELPA
jgi:tRNA pseudouridine55 synthase